MSQSARRVRVRLFSSVAGIGFCLTAVAHAAPTSSYTIPPQSLDRALRDFGAQSGITLLVDSRWTQDKHSPGLNANADPEAALRILLADTGLAVQRNGNVFAITPISASNAPAGAAPAPAARPATAAPPANVTMLEELVVTAQKKEEGIQTVPIAVSAFTMEALDAMKIEGGADLLKAIPNVSFSKNNFSGYNFQIRGVGTKAVSVTTDPAVAVSFNNTPMIRNRLFEQEYYDIERVEALRGPQGTLYGRNATGGVVNVITAKPGDAFDGQVKLEAGNYDTRRLSGFINLPLADTLAIRLAGASTQRDGFDYNSVTDHDVNGRDLWSTRVSVAWTPVDRFRANFIWEHFDENDDRSRTGKQLCTRDPGPSELGGIAITDSAIQGQLSQGCQSASLYADEAYGTPNGNSLQLVYSAQQMVQLGYNPSTFEVVTLLQPGVDPYGGAMQSRDLREIASQFDPRYRARNDIFQLNLDFDLSDSLVLSSQTLYSKDKYYSSQDYNRFNTQPVFSDSSALIDLFGNPITGISPGGYYTDPQLGTSNTIAGLDINTARSKQWSQEIRLQSSFDGPFNFGVGANYLRYKTREDYYVLFNLASAIAQGFFNTANNGDCPLGSTSGCVYVDPNPLSEINGEGHNYFRSQNPYKVTSKAVFGEAYWQMTPTVKITAGLRYTDDKKTSRIFPTQLLMASGVPGFGYVDSGFRELDPVRQSWGKMTGRLAVDWQPDLSFTDQTLVYASYARGYKGGGANPPGIDANPEWLSFAAAPATFKPEYVNAFEIGMKNTLLGGTLILNGSAFYYDYNNYQVSKIVDRTAANENFDTRIWGLELETVWRPTPAFRINATVGYLDTRIADGTMSIDVMNRTQGNPDYTLVKPWMQLTSNCIAPTSVVSQILASPVAQLALNGLCGGSLLGDLSEGSLLSMLTGVVYDPTTTPGNGAGIAADIGGNEMPNSPHYTINIGAQYSWQPNDSWGVTLRGDYYRQGKSYARAYNTAYDRLKAWDNVNVSLTVENEERGLTFQAYVKNLFDDTPITDAFTNSDDSGLTTNVFTLDPRLIGFNISKRF